MPSQQNERSQDNTSSANALWLPEKAASYLRLSEGWMAKLRMNGDGPKFVRMSRRVFYRRCDLDDWISKRITSSTSQKTEAERSRAA